MGLFDNIKLEIDEMLPEFEPTTEYNQVNVEWQTKDIQDPCMDTYIIKDNRLIKVCHEWEEVPMGERVNVAGMNVPLIRPKKTWEEDTNYHGKFSFYTLIQESGDKEMQTWYEYEAKFTDGELINIKIISKNSTPIKRIVTPPTKRVILA